VDKATSYASRRLLTVLAWKINLRKDLKRAAAGRDYTDNAPCTQALAAMLDNTSTTAPSERGRSGYCGDPIGGTGRDGFRSVAIWQDLPFQDGTPDHSSMSRS
jgi:hypothetical protein